jgi:hypothetical protein
MQTHYEQLIEKYRIDKKKLTKLCRALEEDLIRKDQELRKIQESLNGLRPWAPSPSIDVDLLPTTPETVS